MGTGTHAIVEQVKIEYVDDKIVSFATRTASRSDTPDDCVRRIFTCAVSEVWTSPKAGDPAAVEMKIGATGNLYLSKAGWETKSSDGYSIYGAGTALAMYKYPEAAAASALLSPLVVVPSQITVRGMVAGDSEIIEIDLLGPEAAQAQDIVWTSADHIAIKLTRRGSRRLYGHSDAVTTRLWPTRITVSGSPEVDRTVTGQVNLLDSELAALVQHIKFARHGAHVVLSLTPDGVSAFHVVPGAGRIAPRRHGASQHR